jgi:hypothetical protein
MGWNISPAHAAGLSPAHSIWVGSDPAQDCWARSGLIFFYFFVKRKIEKYLFVILQASDIFLCDFD